MCVSWKNTLIRIINELWVEKWGVAEQTRVLLVKNTAIHCQRVLDIKSQIQMQVWWKPISFVIHKVAMTTNEGWLYRIHQASQRKARSLWTEATVPVQGPQEGAQSPPANRGLSPGIWTCCLVFLQTTGWEKPCIMECGDHVLTTSLLPHTHTHTHNLADFSFL